MLLRIAAAYAAGLLLPWLAALPAVAVVLGARRRRRDLAWAPAVLLALLLGGLDRPRRAPPPTERVRLHGWIAAAPEAGAGGTRAPCVVEALGARSEAGGALRGRRVLLRRRGPLPAYGTRVACVGQLRPPAPRRHFGPAGEASLLAGQGLVAVLEAESLAVLPGGRGPAWRRTLVEPLRVRLRAAIESTLAPREAGLLVALLVGERDGVDFATRDAWAALGTAHVLSISGMHVALVAAAALLVGGGPQRRRGLVILLAAVWGYSAVGGFGPTVLRAALMTTWGGVATWLGRDRRPLVALGVATLGLLLQDAHRRSDLGLQLSCLATAGLLVWAPLLASLATRWGSRGRLGKLAGWAATSAGIGLGAQLATLPLCVAQFGAVPVAGPLANLALVPLTDAALVLALLGTPATLVAGFLGRPLLLVAGALLHVGMRAADAAVRAQELRLFVRVDVPTLAAATLLAAAALGLGAALGARRRRAAVAAGVAAVLATIGLVGFGLRPTSAPWRLEALDIGQGDALVLGVGRATWLVDAGDARPTDQGARVVVPHLRRSGVRRLRGLVLTHPHRDHCGGAASVLRALAVDTLYVARASGADTAYAALRAASPHVPVRFLARGAHLDLGPGYAATVLWPESTDVVQRGANDCSLVLWAHGVAGPDVVLAGDLEADGEARLLATAGGALAAVPPRWLVLKAGHHGSDTSSSPAWLETLDPECAILSVGARNRYGHPGHRTLTAFASRQLLLLRTDVGGAVRLVRRGGTVWLERPEARARPLPVAGLTGRESSP